MRTLLRIVLMVALAACSSACATGAGDGGVVGSVYLEECELADEAFNLEVSFFAADYFENSLTVRLQRSGSDQFESDGVVFVVYDVDYVAAHLGEPIEVTLNPTIEEYLETGPDATALDQGRPVNPFDSLVRATFYLNQTCEDNQLGFTDGEGVFTFDAIYVPEKTRRIKGEFQLSFIDPRTWDNGVVMSRADLFGQFDFNYSRGTPAQTFP